MKYQLLSATSLLLHLALSAPVAQETNNVRTANKQRCSTKPHPALEDFQKARVAWCNEHVRADAPNPPLLPTPVIDPKNPPVMPPLRAQYTCKLPNPDKKKPEIVLRATFEIRGWAPIQRDMCLVGWGAPSRWKDMVESEQIGKGDICLGPEDHVMVQGWNASLGWNDYGVMFG
jgi:hypothetical protein